MRSCPRGLDAAGLTSENGSWKGVARSHSEDVAPTSGKHTVEILMMEVGGGAGQQLDTCYREGVGPILQSISPVNHCLPYTCNI